MFYEFTLEDQNKIIFENALSAAKKLLGVTQENYNNHQKLAPDDSSGEENLADNLPFFQDLYDWLYLLQNQSSIRLSKEIFLKFKEDYWGYGEHINIFLSSFKEVIDSNCLKVPKNLKQQAMLTYYFNSQINRIEKEQTKENNSSLIISPTNKIILK